jgi:hypothetical protein
MIPLDENRFLQAGKGPENTKEKNLGDALGLFRFMINFPTCFTISKAHGSCGARLGYLILHLRPLILRMSTPWGFFTLDMISANKTKQRKLNRQRNQQLPLVGKSK